MSLNMKSLYCDAMTSTPHRRLDVKHKRKGKVLQPLRGKVGKI